MELTASQAIAIRLLVERERHIEQDHLVPLRADYAAVFREVEAAHALPAGGIGNGWAVDLAAGQVVPVAPPEAAGSEADAMSAGAEG